MTRQVTPSSPREDSDASVPETVRNEATEIARSAAERSGQVTDVIGEQAKSVLSEIGHQARHLLGQGADELRGQAREGQRKLAGGLRGLADQLHSMSEGSQTGMASDAVRQVSQRASSAAAWLESREPGDLLQELRDFARRRPGVFLAGATLTGALVGRLTRNLVTAATNDEADHGHASTSDDAPAAPPAELNPAMTGTSGHPGTGPARS